jgi:hypothetical protein
MRIKPYESDDARDVLDARALEARRGRSPLEREKRGLVLDRLEDLSRTTPLHRMGSVIRETNAWAEAQIAPQRKAAERKKFWSRFLPCCFNPESTVVRSPTEEHLADVLPKG